VLIKEAAFFDEDEQGIRGEARTVEDVTEQRGISILSIDALFQAYCNALMQVRKHS